METGLFGGVMAPWLTKNVVCCCSVQLLPQMWDHFLSVRRRPALTFRHFDHLLLNHLTNFNQTSQVCSFGGPLSKLFKDLNSIENWLLRQQKRGKLPNLKKSSCPKVLAQFKNYFAQMFLGVPSTKIVQIFLIRWKTWPFSLYVHC